MEKMTHLIFAFLVLVLFGFMLNFPIYMSAFAFVGVLIPDLDMKPKKLHRKLFHNIWILIIFLFIGSASGIFFNREVGIVFSVGFISHLIADSLTHNGIMPLWPVKKPKFNGPIRTGGLGEYLIVLVLLVMIYWIGTMI
jgi:inner membrane protein